MLGGQLAISWQLAAHACQPIANNPTRVFRLRETLWITSNCWTIGYLVQLRHGYYQAFLTFYKCMYIEKYLCKVKTGGGILLPKLLLINYLAFCYVLFCYINLGSFRFMN